MKKVFLFENEGGQLHKCLFAGLDDNGHPQWMMVDQGKEIMMLEEYLKVNLMKRNNIRMLCLEGEKLESATMAHYLGAVLQDYPVDRKRALSKAVTSLKDKGFKWQQNTLKVKVFMHEYYEEAVSANRFRFTVYCAEGGPLLELDCFKTTDEMLDALQNYYDAVYQEAGITLKMTTITNIDGLKLKYETDI